MDENHPKRASRPLPPVQPWLPEHKLIEDAGAIGEECVTLALLRTLRDLRLWTSCLPGERFWLRLPPTRSRFETIKHASDHSKDIAGALTELSTMRLEPDLARPGALGEACRQISRWAMQRSLPNVGLMFAEAAARVDESVSVHAREAGQAAKYAGVRHRSEDWLDRAIRLAGRDGNRNRIELIRALLAYGNLLREQAKYAEARSHLTRAARLAASTRRHRIAAVAQHDLVGVTVMDGTYTESEGHIREALRYYPIHHPAIPSLVHDWSFLLSRTGRYHDARPLVDAVLPHTDQPELELILWGMAGLVAAGTGDQQRFDLAVEQVRTRAMRSKEFAAAAHGHLAQGARLLGAWDLARSLIVKTIDISRTRQESEVEILSKQLLAGIESQEAPSPALELPRDHRIKEITVQFNELLKARLRPSRRPVQIDLEIEPCWAIARP